MRAFDYVRVRTLAEAEAALEGNSEARLLAGGHTLLPALRMGLAEPPLLVDLGGVGGLAGIGLKGGRLVIGALARHAVVAASAEVRRALPALARLAEGIGDPAVRHRGTLGGSIANNDPAADYPAAALALDAEIATTRRVIPADTFFRGMFETALDPGEIITELRLRLPLAAGYAKFPQPASRYALTGVFIARFEDGVRVAVTGAGPCVFRAHGIEAALTESFTPRALRGIVPEADGLLADLHAQPAYRAALIAAMAEDALALALA